MSLSFFASAALLALGVTAQSATQYTDDKTGITFNGLQDASGFRFGIALPETLGSDLVAQIVGPTTEGWAGASFSASMAAKLLVVAWPNGDEVVASFRQATGYTSPPVVTGDISMTPIPEGTYVNDTAFSYTFLCSGCIYDNGLDVSAANAVLGWAYSDTAVTTPSSASSAISYHTAGFGGFGFTVANAQSANYATWAAMATGDSGTGNSTTPGNSTLPGGGNSTLPVGGNVTATISNTTYDYVVAGAGAAGIIVAQRLVESGSSVLLIERGGPSLAITGNNNTLPWNSSVTMFDVPGVDYYLSSLGDPSYCTDTADQAGCLLGGGTMVNAMMWVKPQDKDFDSKWPAGWKWADVSTAADRLYERNPGQTYGSIDGVRHNNQAYDVLSQFLSGEGFSSVDAVDEPNKKIDVFSHPPWSTANGLRSGPVRTYLPLAQGQSNFKLMLNTKVVRAVRSGSTITGIETESATTGARVIYNLNTGGKAILAAGSMSTPRILFNSGIGPTEQIQTVASGSVAVTLPPQADWINLPVGAEIKDHPIFTLKFTTKTTLPALASTQFTSPNQTSIDLFAKGSGVLAQSGQRLNFWTAVNTTAGNQYFVQGTCNGPANNTIQMKVYLTHGITSTGSLGITADGSTELITKPWLRTDEDIEAITLFMDRLLEMTRKPNSTLTFLSAGDGVTGSNVTGSDLIKNYVTGAHYVGTAKMGALNESGVVVDTDTKVYGTDNLFVVDASMHPDLPTGNTQAIVMVAAEAAAARILAFGGATNGTSNSTTPVAEATGAALPSGVALPTGTLIPTGVVTSSPAIASSSTAAKASKTPNMARPWWYKPSQPKNNFGKSNGEKTSTTKETAAPTLVPRGLFKRTLMGRRVPVGPDTFEDEVAYSERVRMERASFLDAYRR